MTRKEKNPFIELLRKRRRMSQRMIDMIEDIRKRGRIHYMEFKTYHDKGTINALINRCMVHMGMPFVEGNADEMTVS